MNTITSELIQARLKHALTMKKKPHIFKPMHLDIDNLILFRDNT